MSKKNHDKHHAPEAPAPAPAAAPPDAPAPPASPPSPELPPITPAELAALQARAAKAEEYLDHLRRSVADFDNYKKRTTRERQEAVQYANERLLLKLMPVLDNLDMAIAAAGTAASDDAKAIHTGVTMILQQLKATLTEFGLEEINATGQPFDPNLHEALMQQESADVPEGQVLQQHRKGYRLNGRLLRAASVIIAKPPAPPADPPQS
jgi:molecular chaperone GrpE